MAESNLTETPRNANPKLTIKSLPKDLLTHIIMKVAASSLLDVFNIKLVAKLFNDAANDTQVFKVISVKDFPMRYREMNSPNEAASKAFLTRCRENENLEAIYKQGVIDFFGRNRNEENGYKFLNQAAELGYPGACYIFAILMILSKNEAQKEKAVRMIGYIKRSNNATVKGCRLEFLYTIKRKWETNEIHGQEISICTMKNIHGKVKVFGWKWFEDDIDCDACQLEEELAYFCSRFRPVNA